MKINKELIVKIELSGDELEHFKSALEKVVQGESASHLGIGILKDNERKLIEEIIKVIQK